ARIAVAIAKRYRPLPVKVRELRRGRVELQAVAIGQYLGPLGLPRTQHRELVGRQGERAAIGPAREQGLVNAHAVAALKERGGDSQASLVDSDNPCTPGQRVRVVGLGDEIRRATEVADDGLAIAP